VDEQTYYLLKQGKKKFAGIGKLIKDGPAICLFDERTMAERSALRLSQKHQQPFRAQAVKNLFREMKKCLDQGYAGALLNEQEPIFFVETSEKGFILIQLLPNSDECRVLDESGTWMLRTRSEVMRPLTRFERIDQRLVDMIDQGPFWGYSPELEYFTIIRSHTGNPFLFKDKCGSSERPFPNGVLYSCKEFAAETLNILLTPEDKETCSVMKIPDLADFIQRLLDQHYGILLNFAYNRALQGRFFRHEEQLLLESYSGFWRLEHNSFQRRKLVLETDRDLESTVFFRKKDEDDIILTFGTTSGKTAAVSETGTANVLDFTLEQLTPDSCKAVERTGITSLVITITRSDLEQKEYRPLLTLIESIHACGRSVAFKNGLHVKIAGFADETEALSHIGLISEYYKFLFEKLPFLIYFLSPEHDQIRTILLALSSAYDHQSGTPGEHVSEDIFQTMIDCCLHGMRFALLLDDDPADMVQKIFEAFDLDPDPDLYERLLQRVNRTLP